MRYLRLVNDGGSTRFDEGEIDFARSVFAPPAPPLDVSPAWPAREMLFIRFPAGWTDPSHPAPARQWMFVLAGRGEVTAGAETRPWGAGDVILLEDVAPPGHGTRVLEDALFAVVRD